MMRRKYNFLQFGCTLVFLILISGTTTSDAQTYDDVLNRVPGEWRSDVANVLELAGEEWNEGELIEALETYPVGSSKYRAMCFLIANMDKHLFVDYVNTADPLNPFSPEDGSGEWLREYIYDYSGMSAELLIENIEWAFLARESFPWCASLPEDIFFEYVLPYRSTQEPLHSWRPLIFETYVPLIEGLEDALEVSEAVNTYNTGIFNFDSLYYRHPEDLDIPTLLASGAGRCEDMSNISNYSLRSMGVPTTSDFTPRWPKGDNNHAWNVVYYGGTWYSFMGCEARTDPIYDTIKNRDFAKVYRKSFAADPIMGPAPDGTASPRLMRVAALDVTSEYTSVSDIDIWVDNPSIATFLCVFNFNSWQAVAGAWVENDMVHFPDVGNHDILYCATRYIEDEFGWGDHNPVAQPFILTREGEIVYTNACPYEDTAGDISLTGWTGTSNLEAGLEVTLFRYVDVEPEGEEIPENPMMWKIVGNVQTVDVDGSVTASFTDAAVEGGLYLLSDSGNSESFREGIRPFVWSEGEIVYY